MLDTKTMFTKMLTGFRGCDETRKESLGTVTSITPTHDGWLVAAASAQSSSGLPPTIRISVDNLAIAESTGVTYAGAGLYVGAPVKAGKTYTILLNRATIGTSYLYY